MRNLVAGTAGHIDHGKSSLIYALTGMDTDTLAEEKRRGITIDLGFAHLSLLSDLRVGFIDVPGHERFVKNMLAGIGGIDLVLFVVAADESVKPQTREHFEICRLLGIKHGIVVITKADLVDPEIVELVKLEFEELTENSFLAGAPAIAVSARTGAGIPELKNAIASAAQRIPLRSSLGEPRLPIDRAFSAKGFGTVVTGTLTSGSVNPEAELQLYPTNRVLRVRGVQVFGSPAARADAGQRTAINLAGIEPGEIRRGMTLAASGRFTPVATIDCSLELLASAKPLKHRAPVHFHSGTSEIEAEVRLFNRQAAVRPGTHAWVRLILREPSLLLPGDRYIIRMFSPVTTIGGGRVVDISGHRYRRNENAANRIQLLDTGSLPQRVAMLVSESTGGLPVRTVAAQLAVREQDLRCDIPAIHFLRAEDWLISALSLADHRSALLEQLRQFHKNNPLVPGLSKAGLSAPPELIPELLRNTTELVLEQDFVRLRTHKLVLQEDESAARKAIEGAFETAGLAVPAQAEVLSLSGIEDKRAKSILQLLLRERVLVRISSELVFHASALEQLHRTLAARKGARISVGDFKELSGVSRKYAIPLLEYADREKWTRRDGDARIVI